MIPFRTESVHFFVLMNSATKALPSSLAALPHDEGGNNCPYGLWPSTRLEAQLGRLPESHRQQRPFLRSRAGQRALRRARACRAVVARPASSGQLLRPLASQCGPDCLRKGLALGAYPPLAFGHEAAQACRCLPDLSMRVL